MEARFNGWVVNRSCDFFVVGTNTPFSNFCSDGNLTREEIIQLMMGSLVIPERSHQDGLELGLQHQTASYLTKEEFMTANKIARILHVRW